MAQGTNESDLYDRVEKWQVDFLTRHSNGDLQYYADAASGLAIALQEIDRERYERTSPQIWAEYQSGRNALKAASDDERLCAFPCSCGGDGRH